MQRKPVAGDNNWNRSDRAYSEWEICYKVLFSAIIRSRALTLRTPRIKVPAALYFRISFWFVSIFGFWTQSIAKIPHGMHYIGKPGNLFHFVRWEDLAQREREMGRREMTAIIWVKEKAKW